MSGCSLSLNVLHFSQNVRLAKSFGMLFCIDPICSSNLNDYNSFRFLEFFQVLLPTLPIPGMMLSAQLQTVWSLAGLQAVISILSASETI